MTLQEHLKLLVTINAEYHKESEPLLLAKQQIERQKKTNRMAVLVSQLHKII